MTNPAAEILASPSSQGHPHLRRFSSRLVRLDHAFLRDRLRGAQQYDRIAGYFRSSIFEVAAEELQTVGKIRVVCNSDLNPEDLRSSSRDGSDKHALARLRDLSAAIRFHVLDTFMKVR